MKFPFSRTYSKNVTEVSVWSISRKVFALLHFACGCPVWLHSVKCSRDIQRQMLSNPSFPAGWYIARVVQRSHCGSLLPSFHQSDPCAGPGLVLVLVQSCFNLWTGLLYHACETHHSHSSFICCIVLQFPSIIINSYGRLFSSIAKCYIGIQTWLGLRPLLLWFFESVYSPMDKSEDSTLALVFKKLVAIPQPLT